MDPMGTRYTIGAFDAIDKEEIEEDIDDIQKMEEKLKRNRTQRRPAKIGDLELELKNATEKLLEHAIDAVSRPRPDSQPDESKVKLSREGSKACRNLFIYIEGRKETFDMKVFDDLVSKLLKELRIGSADLNKSGEHRRDATDDESDEDNREEDGNGEENDPGAGEDEDDKDELLNLVNEIDWASPCLSATSEAGEPDKEAEEEEHEIIQQLEWPFSVYGEIITTASSTKDEDEDEDEGLYRAADE